MKFARAVFLIAAIYGVVILVPGYFLAAKLGELSPPPLTHLEFYYGFYGAALAWQVVYYLISRDPARYRPLMLVGVFAKLSFFGACLVLFHVGLLAPGGALYGSFVDGILMTLFLIAYRRMPAAMRG
jgi:hypothetical protein